MRMKMKRRMQNDDNEYASENEHGSEVLENLGPDAA